MPVLVYDVAELLRTDLQTPKGYMQTSYMSFSQRLQEKKFHITSSAPKKLSRALTKRSMRCLPLVYVLYHNKVDQWTSRLPFL